MTLGEILEAYGPRIRASIGGPEFEDAVGDAIAEGEKWTPEAADVAALAELSPRVRAAAVGAIVLGAVQDQLEREGPA